MLYISFICFVSSYLSYTTFSELYVDGKVAFLIKKSSVGFQTSRGFGAFSAFVSL